MNESYTSFAQVYDMFMDNVDYPAWSKYLIQLLKEYQVEDGLVLDLGCGTGNMTELLAKEGYDMIGVSSPSSATTPALSARTFRITGSSGSMSLSPGRRVTSTMSACATRRRS